jgi:uncharacterized protein DUF5677
MSANAISDAASNTDRFYTVIKSIHNFDKLEVNGVLNGFLRPTPRDNCFIGTYYRTLGNVETMLRMDKAKDFQAIAMLARALFELAVEISLLRKVPDGWGKMLVYADYQKLRTANKIIAFKKNNPGADINTTAYDIFVARNSARVAGFLESMWPGDKNTRHWTGLNLEGRAISLGSPFDQIYAVDYSRLSWYVHPGLAGVMNVPAVTFIHLCAYAFHLTATAYKETLLTVIREFELSKANDKIERLLKLAEQLPFTDTEEQVDLLTRIAQR